MVTTFAPNWVALVAAPHATIAKTGNRHRFPLDIDAFGLKHLVNEIQSAKTCCLRDG